jgi:hypothetical protein
MLKARKTAGIEEEAGAFLSVKILHISLVMQMRKGTEIITMFTALPE